MARLTRESLVVVGNKELKIDDILKTLIYLPANQVKQFFFEIGLTIPRELRMFVLREVLREKVIETRKSRLTLADELNYRLSWFTEFSETQLENLLIFFDDPMLDKDFLEEFWTDLLSYMVEKKVLPKDVKKLVDASMAHVKAVGLELPSMKTYNREISSIFYDSLGRIDGLPPQKFRPVLYKSSTLNEIRDLGSKYGVDVPRRLKKTELADIIVRELKDRGQHTEELETQIRAMSVIVMQRFAIDHDIKASTELKKEEIIEYILANAKETKEAYFVPDSPQVYEKEVEEVQRHVEEQKPAEVIVEEKVDEEFSIEELPNEEVPTEEIVEEVVTEEVIEEVQTVVEEEPVFNKVKEQPKSSPQGPVQYVSSNVDLSGLISEIKALRVAVEEAVKPEETSVSVPKKQVKVEPVVLNTAEFYGDPKSLKKIIKGDEASEREKFIEEKKAQSTIGTDKDDLPPAEIRAIKKIGKGLWRFFTKVILKLVIIVFVVAVILFALYGLLEYFTDLAFLQGISNFLNSIQIAGKGLLQHYLDLLASILG